MVELFNKGVYGIPIPLNFFSEKDFLPEIWMSHIPGKSLLDLLNNLSSEYCSFRSLFTFKYLRVLFIQMAEILQKIHSSNIIHNDLKTENILISQEGKKFFITIIDFGLSYNASPPSLTRNNGGSIPYFSPEKVKIQIFHNEKQPSTKKSSLKFDPYPSEIFSLGVVYYVMLFGRFPHNCVSANPVKAITDLPVLFSKNLQQEVVDSYWIKFLETILHPDPKKRPTLAQIIDFLKEDANKK